MKPQYEAIEKFVTEKGAKWQKRMGLSHFKIKWIFLDEFYGEDDDDLAYKTTMLTESKWQYLMADIKVYLPSAVRSTEAELEEVVVHELCHVLLDCEQTELLAKHNNQCELATELVTRAVMAGWAQ